MHNQIFSCLLTILITLYNIILKRLENLEYFFIWRTEYSHHITNEFYVTSQGAFLFYFILNFLADFFQPLFLHRYFFYYFQISDIEADMIMLHWTHMQET